MREVVEEYVPKKLGNRPRRKRTNEHLPVNKKLWTKVKKKRPWERMKKNEERKLSNQGIFRC